MNIVLKFFLVAYPILIWPRHEWGYYTFTKYNYLLAFSTLLWVIFAVQILKKHIDFKQELKAIKTTPFIALLFFTIAIGISTYFSVDRFLSIHGEWVRNEGISAWFSYITMFYFSARFLHINNRLFIYMAIVGGLISLYGILQHFHLDFFTRIIEMRGTTRSFGFFDNPNFFGTYLVLVLVLSAFLYFYECKKNWMYLTISSIIFIALLYSGTRSGWVGIAVAMTLLFVIIIMYKRFLIKRFFILMGVFTILFISVNITEGSSYIQRATTIFKDANDVISNENMEFAGSSRMYIWTNALPLIPKYFWIGSGPDTFAKVFPHKKEELKKVFNSENITVDKAHNEYIQQAVTLGVPALIFYLSLVTLVLIKTFKQIKIESGNTWIILAMFTAVIGYLAQAFFNISVIDVAPIYWAFLGILYQLVYKVNITNKRDY